MILIAFRVGIWFWHRQPVLEGGTACPGLPDRGRVVRAVCPLRALPWAGLSGDSGSFLATADRSLGHWQHQLARLGIPAGSVLGA